MTNQPVDLPANAPQTWSESKSGSAPSSLSHLRRDRTNLIGLMSVVVLYVALAAMVSQRMHFSRALDEGYHLEYVTFLKQHGRLPITYAERAGITRADFPPLYHLLVALLSAKVNIDGPPAFKNFWDSFRYRAIDHQTDQIWTLETEDYQRPYSGEFLVWQIGRWTSIILSLTTIIVVFLTLQESPLGRIPLASLAGAALLAFLPRYLILGAALNDDNLLGLLAALYFLMLVKAIKAPRQWGPFVAMGVFLGLSMTVKYTLVVVPLELVVICGLLAKRSGLGWAWFWRRMAVVGLLATFCSSWWFGWNLWFLNTVADDGWFVGLLRPVMAGGHDTTLNRVSGLASGGQAGLTALPAETNIGTFPAWVQTTFTSFWGVRLGDSIPLSPYVYLAIGLMLAVVAWGLWRLWQSQAPPARAAGQSAWQITNRYWVALFAFHTGLFLVLPLIRFELTRRLSVAAQGRHILMPAAAAVAGLLVWGLATAMPQRWQRPALALVVAGLIGWTGAHIDRLATFVPPPLPMRTDPSAAGWLPYPVQVQFGESAELVTYDIEPQPERGLLRLSLAWRALAYTNESYLLKVMVVDAAGRPVSYWMGYNGQGRLPSLAWDPGDVIFDRLALPLPTVPAGEYTVQVQMLDGAEPLPVKNIAMPESGQAGVDTLLLADFSLSEVTRLPLSRQMTLTGPQGPLEVAFGLWQAAGPVETGEMPEYRYPGTISVVVSNSRFDQAVLRLYLVDEAGQVWPARQSEANIYTFIIGPRWPSGRYRLQMTLQTGNDEVIGQTVSMPLLSVTNWWERRFEAPDIAVPLEANFADQIMLLGYKLPQKQVKAGQAFPITLYWQAPAQRAPQADFIQFNNLLNSSGQLYGGYDRRPLEYYNTLLWAPGEVVIDGYAVPVEPDAPPGEYYLDVGFYLTVGESAVNLPLVVDGRMTDVSSVTIGPVEVVAP